MSKQSKAPKKKKAKAKFWHELTAEQQIRVRKKGATTGMTWELFTGKFMQPSWCVYPGALTGIMGCWKLMGSEVHGIKDCKKCDCNKMEAKHET